MRIHQENFTLSDINNGKIQWIQGVYADQPGKYLHQDESCCGIMTRTNDDTLYPRPQYYCNNEFLVSSKSYMSLKYLGLRSIVYNNIDGIQLYAGNECIELFGPTTTINKWYQYFKYYCVQNDFQNQFDIIKLVGKGQHASIYKIINKQTKNVFALKVFKKFPLEQALQAQLAILKEIEILRQFDHPQVIRLYEVYEDSKKIYLVLEYLSGADLHTALKNQQEIYDESLVQQLMETLLMTIQHIHNQQIIHRDIKLENIILRNADSITDIVIVDFGLADFYDPNCRYLFPKCGTVGYVAPEILDSQHFDFKADIFSAGVILFILLSGDKPFDGELQYDILHNNLQCEINYKKLNKCTPLAIDLVKSMLNPNPFQRISAKTALQHKWFKESSINQEHQITYRINELPTLKPNLIQYLYSKSPLWNQPNRTKSVDSPFQLEPGFFGTEMDQDDIIDDTINIAESPSNQMENYKNHYQIRKGSREHVY